MTDDLGRDDKGRFIRDDQVIARCLEHLAIGLDLIGDVLGDIAMDAAERIRIAQELQNRAGLVMGALRSIDTAMDRKASEKLYSSTVAGDETDYVVIWEDDGGSINNGEGG